MKLVRVTTEDGLRLEGGLTVAEATGPFFCDAWVLIHGTGSNFYGSTLLETLAESLLTRSSAVLAVNTRGHDLVSVVAAPPGARRLGAAFERVDDCRHDLWAWIDQLTALGYLRIGLLGHSLGAVKAFYLQRQRPHPAVQAIIGVSPARLSHAHFLHSHQADLFQQTLARAEALIAQGEGDTLMEVRFPLPYLVTATGYVDKYGPGERYNVVAGVDRWTVPTLVTFGSQEVQSNVAFRGLPDDLERAVAEAAPDPKLISVQVIAGADHVYTGARDALAARILRWIDGQKGPTATA